jgi:membrane protease YdiL (CAAX protease family)
VDEPAAATLTRRESLLARLWRDYVTDVRDEANARAEANTRNDVRAVAVLLTVAISLTCAEFWGTRESGPLGGLARWAAVTIACYVIPPVLVIKFVLRERVADFGLRIKGIAPHARIYLLLFSLSFPAVVIASFTQAFQDKYPFLSVLPGESLTPDLWVWWALYWAQFVALEFFFRGFIVHGLVPRLGWISIFVMVVPYNMLHYDKPMLEALAAIVGGAVLGTLSLKTRSIWWGAALHIGIAATMDICALLHAGRLLDL